MTKESDGIKIPLINKDSAISIGVVIAMIGVAVWTTTSHEVMKSQLCASEQKIAFLTERIEKQELALAAHAQKGINGYPHPEGILAEINKF